MAFNRKINLRTVDVLLTIQRKLKNYAQSIGLRSFSKEYGLCMKSGGSCTAIADVTFGCFKVELSDSLPALIGFYTCRSPITLLKAERKTSLLHLDSS